MAILETKNLTYTYGVGTPFEKTAVENVNLSVEKGAFVGVIGHTGSGKSALIQMLTTLTTDYLVRRLDEPDAEMEVEDLRALSRAIKERAQAARATQDYDVKLREAARREAEEDLKKAVDAAAREGGPKATPEEIFRRVQAIYRGEA